MQQLESGYLYFAEAGDTFGHAKDFFAVARRKGQRSGEQIDFAWRVNWPERGAMPESTVPDY